MRLYTILFVFDILVSFVVFYYFLIGLIDKSISTFNIGTWLILLLGIAGIILAGWYFHKTDHHRMANLILSVLAFPGMIYLIFLLSVIFGNQRWN